MPLFQPLTEYEGAQKPANCTFPPPVLGGRIREGGHNRRDFLRNGLLAGAGVGAALLGGAGCGVARKQARALTGPTPAAFTPLPADAGKAGQAAHVLNRIGFGPRPGEVARVAAMGAAAYIEEQLADEMEEDPAVAWRVNGLETLQTEQDAPDVLYSLDDGQLMTEMQQAALLRAVYSRRQLRENLADFWTNHFNIYALKADGRNLLPTDTERVIRPHVLGTFRDLLFASAHSPAMLTYLDAQQNRRGVANENYARELLELHTLGVHSGYTLKDIQEVARCFTGWTVKPGFQRGLFTFRKEDFTERPDWFRYEAARHDDGAKYVPFLNLTISPGGGQRDAETVLEHLAAHPATAHFLCRKLCTHFLGHAPDAVVAKAARAYLKNGSDIRATLRPILLDALLTPEQNRPKLKRPVEMMVSALRALAADTDGGIHLQHHLAAMGQPLFQWPMPDGFPTRTSAWTGSLLPRWNFALALASNAIEGTVVDLNTPLAAAEARTDDALLDALIATVIARPPTAPEARPVREQVRRHIAQARQASVPDATVIAEATGLLLASPVFQWG
ncbi:MAG TPA: DUF1800 domain-containing protein [Chthonomonadaceae bacterium]|nr:DUF1800 domain-containing protein [Chthonomonadaceae bacterium]